MAKDFSNKTVLVVLVLVVLFSVTSTLVFLDNLGDVKIVQNQNGGSAGLRLTIQPDQQPAIIDAVKNGGVKLTIVN